jgi:hypothetical protein
MHKLFTRSERTTRGAAGFQKFFPERALLQEMGPVLSRYLHKKTPLPEPPIAAGCFLYHRCVLEPHSSVMRVQADILDRGPHDGETTGLGGEHIDLIGALPHEASETLNGIRGLNVPVHALASRHKTSTGALHPQSGCALLPR